MKQSIFELNWIIATINEILYYTNHRYYKRGTLAYVLINKKNELLVC